MMDNLTQKVLVNGVGLTYIEQGRGDPLVLVHGSLGDYRTWNFQMEPFSKRYRVIAYSRRYHYPNKWVGNGSDYSASLHADDLAELIKTLRLGQVHLVGSSYGAYTALLTTVKHPQLVRTLVLGEPPLISWLNNSAESHFLKEEFFESAWKPAFDAFKAGNLELGVRAFIDGVMGKGAFDQLPQPARSRMMENAFEMKAETSA